MPIQIRANFAIGNALAGLNSLQKALDAAKAKADALTQSLLAVGAAASAVGPVSVGRGSVSRSAQARPPRPPAFNPFQNNPQAGMAYFAQGATQGNPFAARMYGRYSGQYNGVRRNQANAQNYMRFGGPNNPHAAIFAQAFGSTRFGRGGGQVLGHIATALAGTPGGSSFLSSMIGAGGLGGNNGLGGFGSAGSLVGGALGGPIGAGVGAIIGQLVEKVVGKFMDTAKRGPQAMNEWNASLARGGGSVGQARSAKALGGALGTDIAGVGAGLDPYAAARLGLNPNSGPFGDTNYNARGLRVVDDIRRSRTRGEARRKAILAGNPDLSKVFDYSEGSYQALRNQPGSGFQRNAGMLAGSQGRLSTAWDNLMATLSGPAVKAIAKTFDWLASRLELFNKVLTYILDHLPKVIQNAIGYDPNEAHRKAVDKNTDALNDATNAYREGTYGGGGRASGAIPRGLSPAVNHAYNNAAYGVI